MSISELTGSRIRARRLDLGLKQADLAKACDISASYLNLIEHNRRRIGGGLLAALARALETDPGALSQGAGGALTTALEAASAAHANAGAEVSRAEDFADRFPGWAKVIEAQGQRIQQLDRLVEILNNRLTHDPLLGAAMHDVLSTATAIRSTSGILSDGDVDPEWQTRFHRNLYEDSQRLAEAAGSLVRYLDADEDQMTPAALTPLEELEAWLTDTDWQVPSLERALPPDLDSVLEGAGLATVGGRALARRWLKRYLEDAQSIPAAELDQMMQASGPDPAAVARHFGTDLATALRRIGLRGNGALVICDGSGTLTFRKPADGFDVPRFGATCPLWPLFEALQRPLTPIRMLVELPGAEARRYMAYAISMAGHPDGFDGPAVVEATMLLLPQEGADAETARAVGTSCRICPRADCAARREPSILGEGL